MDEILERVRAHRPALERWLRALPGYAGYKEKELRREADRLMVLMGIPAERGLAQADALDEVIRRIRTMADRSPVASYGYADFFNAVHIGERELEALYRFDADLLQRLEDLEAFTEAFDQALRAGEDPTPAFHHLDGTSLALRILWDRRVEALAQIL